MRTSTSKQGFTLPEVVITSVIALILMIPISRIAYSTIASTRYARDVGSAIAAGQEKLEEFSEVDYSTIASGTSTKGDYSLDWTVTTQQSAKIVRLNVNWTLIGKSQSINLNAIYAE